MGNHCHGSGCRKINSKKLSTSDVSAGVFTFNLEKIKIELKKDASKIDLNSILDELKKLNSCSIAVRDYALNNFNVALANVLCATCFSTQEQLHLSKLILDKATSVNLDDLLLSCLEFSSPQISSLILSKCSFTNENNVNQFYNLNQRLYGFDVDQKATLMDFFFYKCIQSINYRHGNKKIDINYCNLLNSLMNTGFRIFNLKLLERNSVWQTLLFFDLNGVLVNDEDFLALKNLFNRSLIDRIENVTLYCNQANTLSEKIEYRVKFYYLIRQSPNFVHMNEDAKLKLKLLYRLPNYLHFNPLKLTQMCRQTFVNNYKSRVNLNTCIRSLPKRIISFLYYEQEFIEMFEF